MDQKSIRPKNFSPALGNIFTFCVFADRTPRGGKSQNTGFLGPLGLGQPLGTWRNSWPKTGKHNFPEVGGLLGNKSARSKIFSPKSCNFFTFCVLADRTPTGGKSQHTGVLGPFGLGQPLAQINSRQKRKNTISRC